ncbi:MAG: hypothetical protein ACJ0GW_02025 [Candidatus Actinomarina sp.]
MKKLFIVLSCAFFINATLDNENIDLEIERIGENSVKISWSINYEEYDEIVLEVLNQNNAERTLYILPSLNGTVELCCFEGDVGATITITKSTVVDKSDENCSAISCIEYVKEDYFNSKIVTLNSTTTTTIPPPATTTTSTTTTTIPPPATTTTSTTTTTIPPVVVDIEDLLNVEITNALITSIPLFEDIDFTDQEKNTMGAIITTGIIVLFYFVLLLQEWFNKIISTYQINWFKRERKFSDSNKITNFLKISIVLIITSFLIGYVEEGASLGSIDLENIAIFIAAFIGLITVTIFYDGLEGLIERQFYGEVVYYQWAPQAILFATISTLSFIIFQMPIGFIFGFIASSYIVSTRIKATISPKFFSSLALSIVAFAFFYLTSLNYVNQSGLLTAICSLTYLMCLEGVIFKSLPGGGNELSESINDSEGLFKLLPLISFVLGVWLFIRILIIPPNSEFATFQQDLLGMGSFSLIFGAMLVAYILVLLVLGTGIKLKGDNEE